MHCTTEYPTPFEAVNISAIETIREAFGLEVGFSDHTPGITAPIAAVARGAILVEKHFTLDTALPGPDHKASLDPEELKAMVRTIRETEQLIGDGKKVPHPVEIKNMPIARKSLIAKAPIAVGELFTEDNLTVKRPGTGISPMQFWEWVGKPADRDYEEDEIIGQARH
jgi:sialic acid synthase SpsE